MNRRLFRAAAALLLLSTLATGCKKSAEPAATTAPPDRPQVTPAPNKLVAPDVERFADYSLRLKPAQGPETIFKEPIAAQLIMDTIGSKRLQVTGIQANYGNRMELIGPDGKTQHSFEVASDGQLLFRDKDKLVYRMPEYLYYLLENSLWTSGGSLMRQDLQWDPTKGTAQLELELPRLIKAAMLPAYGYSLAYFCNYKIYGVNTETRNMAKVYILMTYAGYDVHGESFSSNFLYTSPATLILTMESKNTWRLTGFKQPKKAEQKKDIYTNVRAIFPYDYMDEVMDDLDANMTAQVADMQRDIVRQATEYLNTNQITGVTAGS